VAQRFRMRSPKAFAQQSRYAIWQSCPKALETLCRSFHRKARWRSSPAGEGGYDVSPRQTRLVASHPVSLAIVSSRVADLQAASLELDWHSGETSQPRLGDSSLTVLLGKE
jgi:hypothetical protein